MLAYRPLGNMPSDGDGGPSDLAEARRLLGLAAAKGDTRAQVMLADMHLYGDKLCQGEAPNFAEARRLYGLAAAQGNTDAQQWFIRLAFAPDFAEARRLYELAEAEAQRAVEKDRAEQGERAAAQQERKVVERKEQCRALAARQSQEEEAARQRQQLESRRVEEEAARHKAQLKEKSEAKKKERLDKKEKKKGLSPFVMQEQREQLAREERLAEEARATELVEELRLQQQAAGVDPVRVLLTTQVAYSPHYLSGRSYLHYAPLPLTSGGRAPAADAK